MRLHAAAHVGDRLLGRHAEHLGQGKRRHRVDQGGRANGQGQRHQQLGAAVADDLIYQILRGRRGDEAGQPADKHQHEAERQPAAVGGHQHLRLFPGVLQVGLLLLGISHSVFLVTSLDAEIGLLGLGRFRPGPASGIYRVSLRYLIRCGWSAAVPRRRWRSAS